MYMYVNHFTVQQILTPHRKSTILCLKKKNPTVGKKAYNSSPPPPDTPGQSGENRVETRLVK